MKWGHAHEVEGPEQLLYWVLTWVVAQSVPLDRWLTLILQPNGGLGGDPGWEIDHIPDADHPGGYKVWADPDVSGIEPSESIFDAQAFRNALKVTLLAFGDEFSEREEEIRDVIARFDL
ncbi:hypothetical protein ACQ4K0_00350 [Burkholderia cepacia]|uniref:hypothetical protein n=1 Tax=Burkholderia cepacia TaxID=292 RepID=UPI000A6521A1|nr:hypothetical protein [Burkholderia cepacia]NHB06909.1 hypothetical protein [Burkholderia cepacia]